MKFFLRETAEKIISENKNNLHKLCIIFPNKRTKFHFRKHYAGILKQASKPAKMTEISFFIREITGFGDRDKLNLIFDLFEIYKELDPDTSYTFDSFYKTGEIILSDFNETDAWLADTEKIFTNIKDIKEIDEKFSDFDEEQKEFIKNFWSNYTDENKSEEKEIFLKIWNLLPEIHKKLTEKLKKEHFAYNGLIYKELYELIKAGKIKTEDYDKYIFIGFNALNKAEIKLFEYFKKYGNAEFYWDLDKYYIENEFNEAGDFLRKNIKELGLKLENIPDNFSKNKNIEIIGVSSKIGQAKFTASLLEKYGEKNTVIITADENFLFPVLSSIPENIEKINVTMGLSFKLTPLFNFIFEYLKLKTTFLKNNAFYYKNVVKILKHPYVSEHNPELCDDTVKKIRNEKRIFINPGFFDEINDDLLKLIFKTHNEDFGIISAELLNILSIFFDESEENKEIDEFKNEYIFRAYKKIKRFGEILIQNKEKIGIKTASDLLLQMLKTEIVPFEGKTDEGLQISGLMESRNLDFKNVIILGVNEGILPEISRKPTFISQNMRYAFGLPMLKYQDSVFAYFFYRLLQRAENISLLYNNVTDDSSNGEVSRFITQLKYETNFNIKDIHLNDELHIPEKKEISIPKTGETKEVFEKYFTGKSVLSASALITYITCPLKFYFRYVAKLREPEKPDLELNPAELGTVLHKALENIYKDIISENKKISEKILDEKIKQSYDYALAALKILYDNENYEPEGIQIIILNVISGYIKKVLKYDKKSIPFEIVSLENDADYECDFFIKVNSEPQKIKFKAIIDRTDKKDEVYRIIDYKTGTQNTRLFSISGLFDKDNKNINTHAFQALFYLLVLKENERFSGKKIKPALFYVRNLNAENYSEMPPVTLNEDMKNLKFDENVSLPALEIFKEKLTELTEEIFDTDNDFEQTNNVEKCVYCDYNEICGRR